MGELSKLEEHRKETVYYQFIQSIVIYFYPSISSHIHPSFSLSLFIASCIWSKDASSHPTASLNRWHDRSRGRTSIVCSPPYPSLSLLLFLQYCFHVSLFFVFFLHSFIHSFSFKYTFFSQVRMENAARERDLRLQQLLLTKGSFSFFSLLLIDWFILLSQSISQTVLSSKSVRGL